MNEIDHFKVFILCNDDVDHLHAKRIHSVFLLYSYRILTEAFLSLIH
jgi:hypothetical protein